MNQHRLGCDSHKYFSSQTDQAEHQHTGGHLKQSQKQSIIARTKHDNKQNKEQRCNYRGNMNTAYKQINHQWR